MKQVIWIGFLCFLPVLVLAHPRQDRLQPPLKSDDELEAWLSDPNRPKVRLHPLPPIAAPAEPLLTANDEKHISELIAQLAQIKDPDYGISPTMSGSNFAPVARSEHAGAMMLTTHNLNPSQTVLELVKLGPRALPLLLKHLDDSTPTQLTIGPGFCSMRFDHGLDFNEANPIEQEIRKAPRDPKPVRSRQKLTSYPVKVGDVCFAVIGQIVGREYLAVRYEPSAIIIINSPVADEKLAQEVRAVWTSDTPMHHLFQSLLTDYSCRGVYNGSSLDGWNNGSELQCEAAMRLLYYFPTETVAMIALRLHSLKVEFISPANGARSTDKEMATYTKRELANGVRTDEFVKAVSWCPDPHIQAEMAAIVKRTGDADAMTAAVRGIAPSQRKPLTVYVRALLRAESYSGNGWYYESYLVLAALARYWGADARPIFHWYMRKRDPSHLSTVCCALREAKTDWNVDVLRPLLSDRRTISGYGHWKDHKGEGAQIPTRVCDAAATALATWHPGLRFDIDQPTSNLDRQIAVIKAQLAH